MRWSDPAITPARGINPVRCTQKQRVEADPAIRDGDEDRVGWDVGGGERTGRCRVSLSLGIGRLGDREIGNAGKWEDGNHTCEGRMDLRGLFAPAAKSRAITQIPLPP